MRSVKDYILLYFKGMAMGAADVVPGVSGGTIAFIVGIYEELLQTISSVKPSLLIDLKNEGIAYVWKKINGTFLLVLLAGIATSFITFAKLITYLMHYFPIPLWAFFLGLIIASIWYIGRQIKKWNLSAILGLILGAAFVVYISVMPPLASHQSYLFMFFAGAIAACAMILPGISGSFILLLLGAYSTVMSAINNQDFALLVVVAAGAGIGLLSFSKLLNYLLSKFHNTLIAVLTGFLIGSLWKIWPWKTTPQIYVKGVGAQASEEVIKGYSSLSAYLQTASKEQFELLKPYIENNVSPLSYAAQNDGASEMLLPAVLAAVIGFSLIFVIEFIAKKQNV